MRALHWAGSLARDLGAFALPQRCPGCSREAAPEHLLCDSCLQRIPPRLKQLVEMRYRLSFSTQEIAERAGQSSAWVRTTLCRLRKQLRDCIHDKLALEKA